MRSKHENVLPFLGYQIVDGEPLLVSRWMSNGSLETYLKTHENVSKTEKLTLVSLWVSFSPQVQTEGLTPWGCNSSIKRREDWLISMDQSLLSLMATLSQRIY